MELFQGAMWVFLGMAISVAVALALAYLAKSWRSFFAALWLCIFCVVGDGLGIALVASPQGQDFLIALKTSGNQSAWHLHQFWFFSSLLYLAFTSWACARALMYRLGEGMPLWIVTWFPRVFGFAPLLVVLAVFYFNVGNSRFAAVTLLLTLLYAAFVFGRRAVMRKIGKSNAPMAFHGPDVSSGMKRTLILSLLCSLLLFVLFLLFPVKTPQALGAPSIALLAASSWVLFGSIVLVLWPRSYRWPSMAWLPLVLGVAASFSNENNRVRELPFKLVQPSPTAVPQSGDIASDFDEWLKTRQRDNAKPFPVFIVAAEGGGVRAAYWTASVLTRLQSEQPEFAQHVYAVSGVSGGSLGGATFVALLRAQQRMELPPCVNPDKDKTPAATPAPLYDCAQAFLAHDFMSPALAYLFYEDLIQRFMFVSIPDWSRATALEKAWEQGWQDSIKTKTFEEPFSNVWDTDKGRSIPSLLLNGTIVETGGRLITSNIHVRNLDFPDAVGTFDESPLNPEEKVPAFRERMRLSTAVHMSARFTYVSPPGMLAERDYKPEQRRVDGVDKPWGHVIDGGYFENSGGGTAFDLYTGVTRALTAAANGKDKARYANVIPVLVLITNSPSSYAQDIVAGREQPEPVGALGDLLSPALGLMNAREARGRYSLAQIRLGEKAAPVHCVVNFGLDRAEQPDEKKDKDQGKDEIKHHEPILGWFLAEDSRVEMRYQLDELREEVDRVKKLVANGRCP